MRVFVKLSILIIKFLVMIELNRHMTYDTIDSPLGGRRATRTINLVQNITLDGVEA